MESNHVAMARALIAAATGIVPESKNTTCDYCKEREAFKSDGEGKLVCHKCMGAEPIVCAGIAINRNDPCYCRSGKKFKKCCYGKTSSHGRLWVRRNQLPQVQEALAKAGMPS